MIEETPTLVIDLGEAPASYEVKTQLLKITSDLDTNFYCPLVEGQRYYDLPANIKVKYVDLVDRATWFTLDQLEAEG